ncbi:MAG: serine hydrolase [Ktedonobacteraceae bacterium]|nr:serine hydrolase [Ktedonobacteraceae bacterium]
MQRTEGWVAGLQLAAFTMQGSQNLADCVATFASSNRYVLAYLLEEVFEQQSEDIQSFLLSTSLLDRLNGSLLGMHTSTISVHDLQQTGDYALPYMEIKGEVLEIPFYDQWQIIAPAGGINTNLEDIQHWLRFQLNQGKHGETQLLDASQLAQNHTPQTVIPANATHPMGNHPEFASWSYGMGWMIGSYKGHRMIQHGGAIDGFMALIVLLPDEHAGVAVFTNKGSTVVPYMIAFSACDRLLDVEATDWHERLKNAYEQLKLQQAKMEEEINKIEPVPGTQPSHPLEAYCGTYQHPGYGDCISHFPARPSTRAPSLCIQAG